MAFQLPEVNQTFPDLGFTGEKIESMNVSKLVTGTIASQRITLGITQNTAGDVYIGGGTFNAAAWTATNGFILGLDDSDSNREKFFIGGAASSMDWNVTAVNTLTVSGAIAGGTIDIGGADATSFHVDASGNMWLGAATFNLATNPFVVSSAGSLRARDGLIGGWTIITDYLYDLTSGTPTAVPNNGVVMDSGNAALIFYEGTAERVRLGYLSAAVYGLRVFATDGTTVIWESSDTRQVAGGWNFTDTVFRSGATDAASNVLIDSANSLIRLGPTAGSTITIDGANQRIRSSTYTTGVSGFTVEPGLVEAQNIIARGTLSGSVFRYDVISATGGRQVIANADALSTAMTALDASTLTVRGNATFAVNDILVIRAQSSGGIQEEYLRVTGIGAAPTYTVTRDLLGTYAADTNPAWAAGTAVVQHGESDGAAAFSGGWLDLVGEASAGNFPRISVFQRTGVGATAFTERVRMGNLNGYLGYVADTYGFACGSSAGTDANITIDPTNGIRIRNGTTNVITLDNAGNVTVNTITATAGTIAAFTIGGTTISATNLVLTSGVANTANITVGTGATAGGINSANAGGDIIFWGGSTFAGRATAPFRVTAAGALTATSATITGTITMDAGTIAGTVTFVSTAASTIESGGNRSLASLNASNRISGYITTNELAAIPGAAASRVVIGSTGLFVYNAANTNTIALNTDGSMSVASGNFTVSTAGAVTIGGGATFVATAASTIETGGNRAISSLNASNRVSGYLTSNELAANVAGASRVVISVDGIRLYNAASANTISLLNDGSASFAGGQITFDTAGNASVVSLAATAGTIAAFTISGTTIAATNLNIVSGAANTARITVGTGSNLAGMNSASVAGDITFWSGDTFANRATAPFRVTAAGAMTATSATITGALTTSAGSTLNATYVDTLEPITTFLLSQSLDNGQMTSALVNTPTHYYQRREASAANHQFRVYVKQSEANYWYQGNSASISTGDAQGDPVNGGGIIRIGADVYVSWQNSAGTNRLTRYNATLGERTEMTFSGTSAFGRLATDGTDLFMAEWGSTTVRRYTISGTTVTHVSGTVVGADTGNAKAGFYQTSGFFYWFDNTNDELDKYNTAGVFQSSTSFFFGAETVLGILRIGAITGLCATGPIFIGGNESATIWSITLP